MAKMGLSDIQLNKLTELETRKNTGSKPLTENMEKELSGLICRRDNPELPEGAKTYCKKWLKEYLYSRREIVKTKYIDKGNATEEDGFTLMAVQLGLGMVYKNEQFRSNAFLCGTDDLFKDGIVYDNKSCWSLDTFPMFETVNPKSEYDDQLQGYMELRDCDTSKLCYTLNDATSDMLKQALRWIDDHSERAKIANNMVFTTQGFETARKNFFDTISDFKFIPIPDEKRIKTFENQRDRKFIADVDKRVKLCNIYINNLINQ